MMRLLMPLALLVSLTSLPAGAVEPFAGVGSGVIISSTYSPSIGHGMPISNINGSGNQCSYATVSDLRGGFDDALWPGAYDRGGVWLTQVVGGSVVGSNGLEVFENFEINACGLLDPPASVGDPGWDPQRHGPNYCAMLGHSGLGWVRFDGGQRLRLFDLGWKVEGLTTGYYQEYDAAGVAQDRWGMITIKQPSGNRLWMSSEYCGITATSIPLTTFTPLDGQP